MSRRYLKISQCSQGVHDAIKNAPRVLKKRYRDQPIKYKDIVITFDIETTRLQDDQSIMYIWQMQIEDVYTIIGRTWEEFTEALETIRSGLTATERVIVWVHNLGYEFSFLKGIMDFEQVFAVKPRKPLYALSDGIEFRCSYMLTGLSLEKFLEQMEVENKKLKFDYDKIRYPWTKLTAAEIDYCINDVKGLAQAVRKRMRLDGDTIATIPYTCTGYLRRNVKKEYNKIPYPGRRDIMPVYGVYRLLRNAFRGGDCHGNRWYIGAEIDGMESYDRSSSYPDVMLNCKFPVSRFWHEGAITEDRLMQLLGKKALIMKVIFMDVHLHDARYPIPYLAYAKCSQVFNPQLDNGRILSADSLICYITDIDYKILKYQYHFSMTIIDCYSSRYGDLKTRLTDLIKADYTAKTALKSTGMDYEYARSKERLNSYYGLTAQDPARKNVLFVGGNDVWKLDETQVLEEVLEHYNKKAFLPYQFGVWVTAWARYRLFQGVKGIYEAGGIVLYCDTDSVKYIPNGHKKEIAAFWDLFNDRATQASKGTGAVAADAKGKLHYMGVYEYEGCYKFKMQGAKKYITQKAGGPIVTTIAGVSKKKGGAELEASGGFAAFEDGFTFKDSGGLEAVYNDNIHEARIIDGHKIIITDNVCLKPSEYTLGKSADFKRLLYALSKQSPRMKVY